MTKKILSQQELHEIIEYRNGELYWKIKPSKNRQIGESDPTIL